MGKTCIVAAVLGLVACGRAEGEPVRTALDPPRVHIDAGSSDPIDWTTPSEEEGVVPFPVEPDPDDVPRRRDRY